MDIIFSAKDIRTKVHHIASRVCGNTQEREWQSSNIRIPVKLMDFQ